MAAVAGSASEKEPVNIVHRNAIFCETIHKEQRHQKLYTHYGVNPYKKSKMRVPPLLAGQIYVRFSVHVVHVIAGKPNSRHDSADGMEDGEVYVSVFTIQVSLHPLTCRRVSTDPQEGSRHSTEQV